MSNHCNMGMCKFLQQGFWQYIESFVGSWVFYFDEVRYKNVVSGFGNPSFSCFKHCPVPSIFEYFTMVEITSCLEGCHTKKAQSNKKTKRYMGLGENSRISQWLKIFCYKTQSRTCVNARRVYSEREVAISNPTNSWPAESVARRGVQDRFLGFFLGQKWQKCIGASPRLD